jgi:fucose permease
MSPPRPRAAVALVYGTAFLHGLMLVSYPASSTFFKSTRGFTDAQYGLVFLPQLASAIFGAAAGGMLARRIGLRYLFALSLAATGASQLALAAAGGLADGHAFDFAAISAACTGLAFGFGAAPLNAYPALLVPRRAQAALVALHTGMGIGLALGPVFVARFTEAGNWMLFPLGLTAGALLLLGGVCTLHLPEETPTVAATRATTGGSPVYQPAFWGFAAVAVLYSFAEGIFANWSVIYLREERGVPAMTASLALSAFWAALAAGRLLSTALLLRITARALWLSLPLPMIAACLLLPGAQGAAGGIALFALAGLGCSAFFPLTIGLASERFPAHAATVSSLLIAALMLGNGLGSFALGPLREGRSLAALYAAAAVFPAAALLAAWRLSRLPVRAP